MTRMTDIALFAIAAFAAAVATTLCLAAVAAPQRVTRQRARELLLALVHGKNGR